MNTNIYSSKPQQIAESANLIAKKIFGNFFNQKFLIIGENKISFLILETLKKNGLKQFKIINEKEINNKDILEYLFEFDILVTSLKSKGTFIKKIHLIKALKRRKFKPIFLIDINIPGNIESEILKIDNCFLFDLNDLEQFISYEDDKFNNNFLRKKDDDYFDALDDLIPKFLEKLKLDSSQIYLFEQSLRDFFKVNKNFDEKIGILNFLKFFLKK